MTIRPIAWIDTFALSVLVWRERKAFDPADSSFREFRIHTLLNDPQWKVARQVVNRCLGEISKADVATGGTGVIPPVENTYLERLRPMEYMAWAIDGNAPMRFVLPIVSNPGNALYSGTGMFVAHPGQLLMVDIGQLHSAANHGTTPRYHLVIDIRRPETPAP